VSLKSYFPEQFAQLEGFFLSATESVRLLRIDPEMRPMLIKALSRMDEDEAFPHALTLCSQPFTEPVSYFESLYGILRKSYEQNAPALAGQGVTLAAPVDESTTLKAPAKFARYASSLAESLPERVGSLVFIVAPDDVADLPQFRKSMAFLAENIHSHWLKMLVLDLRTAPMLEGLEREHAKIGVQTLYLAPEEIERRVREDLEAPAALSPAERRQYKGLLAGFAFSNRRYDEAAQLQRAWASEAEQEGAPGDAASAHYNLGNTLLAQSAWPDAIAAFCQACELSVANNLIGLAPFAYANLGIGLHRNGEFAQAFASLKVARDMFKAQNHRAGEAYVIDVLAQMYALDGRKAEAEKSWRYCLSLYEGMTSPTFGDLRTSGSKDVREKLQQLGARQ
jgi:tetratricopeptide (TPR) repeat protein